MKYKLFKKISFVILASIVSVFSFYLVYENLVNYFIPHGPKTLNTAVVANINNDPSLISQFKFDDIDESVVIDSLSNMSSGIKHGNVSFVPGKSGKALSLNGVDQYVRVSTSTVMSQLTTFSVSFWAKVNDPDSPTSQTIMNRSSPYHYHGAFVVTYEPSTHTYRLRIETSDSQRTYISSPLVSKPSDWHNIIFSVGPSVVNVYLDGQSARPYPITGLWPLDDGESKSVYKSLNIGAYLYDGDSPREYFGGQLDDIKFYSRALSSDEALSLANEYGASAGSNVSNWTTPTSNKWPKIFGQVGPFSVTKSEQDIIDATNDGFYMSIYGGDPGTKGFVSKYGIGLVPSVTEKLYTTYCKSRGVSCVLSQAAQDDIFDSAKKIIDATKDNPNVAGYWILDDYPGTDVKPLLRRIHDLVAENNKTASLPKPTICGFGSLLDRKLGASEPFTTLITKYSISAFSNYDPNACDLVTLYIYGQAMSYDPSLNDWSMEYLLPQLLRYLSDQGWTPERSPLIGGLHAFRGDSGSASQYSKYYVEPTANDIATQAEAFCKYGAIALFPFIWNIENSDPTSSGIYSGLKDMNNTPEFVRGVQMGQKLCQDKYWSRVASKATPFARNSSAGLSSIQGNQNVVKDSNNNNQNLLITQTPTPSQTPKVEPTNSPVVDNKEKDIPVVVATYQVKSNMKLGSKGDEVKNLQKFLIEKNYLDKSNNTGIYDSKTKDAVGALQLEWGILKDYKSPGFGQTGPKTRNIINTIIGGKYPAIPAYNGSANNSGIVSSSQSTSPISKTLYYGSRGVQVSSLQNILYKQGLIEKKYITGFYGKITENAVKKFQTVNNIVKTGTPKTTGFGVVGPKTRKEINSLR